MSTPSVPQFSVTFIDKSYNAPPTQTTDPYTGIITTKPGHIVKDMRIEVSIKNQRFTPYTDALGRECNLYYRVEVKGHFEENNWHAFYHHYYNNYADSVSFVSPSNSEYTVISSDTLYDESSRLDFRVRAFTGYWVEPTMGDHLIGIHDPRLAEAETSNWSNIQTITVVYEGSSPSSSSPSSDTTNPPQQNPWKYQLITIIVTACIVIIPIAIATYINKQKK
ncbi:MAG: hypothetical protein LBE76_09555 [Nitrososphaerota archaeon]|nr:hypothetical protein [Nitrososphaerota archaeon]